jgi:DMSO/TMAO reductase YedYZ heme-binding membrane subunit
MEGRRIVAFAAVLSAISAAVSMGVYGASEQGLGVALRVTARIGLAFFALAFVASSVNRLWRSRPGKWLLRNRRHLGVSFAVVHFTHAGFIIARALVHSDNFWSARSAGSLVPGTTAYLFLVAMTITSFDGPTKWLGRTRWKVLHKVGMYVLWAIYVGAYAKSITDKPASAIGIAVLGVALLLRFSARLAIVQKRRRAST